MANANPSPATRWTRANPGPGRPPTGWLRDWLSADDGTGRTKREVILDHLFEVATSWEVRIVGKGADGELLKVASGSDSVAAAKLIYSYDIGKPLSGDREFALQLAEHFRQVARDSIDLSLKVLGEQRMATMDPKAIAEAIAAFSVNPRAYVQAAESTMAGDAAESPIEGGGQALPPDEVPGGAPPVLALPSESETAQPDEQMPVSPRLDGAEKSARDGAMPEGAPIAGGRP